ncbi:MAG: hypothetical protein NTW87_15085 [Planctomycetota bacterium]|nr:hypothetical protein [Planctomycetota bacterium]
MAEGELLDAREAMSMLGISEAELQTLVARGDLRAFRSAGTMKFRRDDVMSLKTDKGTEPTIIIPAASQRKGASGILPTVPSAPRPASRVAPAIQPPAQVQQTHDTATSDIVLDDIELMPTDDQHITQQVTVAQPAVGQDLGGATVLEPAATGEVTAAEDVTGPAVPVTASGRRRAIGSGVGRAAAPASVAPPTGAPGVAAPAMSRVRAAVQPGVSLATSKRTQAVYQAKSAGPVWTILAILNTLVLAFTATIVGVMMSVGHYDRQSSQRVIPPFLSTGQFRVYEWCYYATPGDPADKDRPSSEFPPKGN